VTTTLPSIEPPGHDATLSTALRGQALSSLRELLLGLRGADLSASRGAFAGQEAAATAGLVSVVLRLGFVLFAEARGLLPLESEVHARSWSLTGLHAELRPQISDGAVLRALDPLLTIDGERLRYRDLDVEHLGTLHEGLMGYEVKAAQGPSLTLKPADVVVDLEQLLALSAEARLESLAAEAGLEIQGKLARKVKAATTVEALTAALAARVSKREPALIPRGALFLQPGSDRRRSGAHYTSRAVTRVLVERALAPLLAPGTSADTILTLKVCDPAMGGGALLIEACRQLASRLVVAWDRDGTGPPEIAADQRVQHARRLVARGCLHGVDRNPLAVHVARLSLWLIASSRDEPLTFVDHALRCGDSLVGLSALPIAGASIVLGANPDREALSAARTRADLALAAFFSTRDKRARARAMEAVAAQLDRDRGPDPDPQAPELAAQLAAVRARYAPFHWGVEFPGVFSGPDPGFDVIVGNPPWVSYSGRAAQPLDDGLRDFYAAANPAFHGFRNLQGLFVHRFAEMLRPGGRLGLVLPTSTSDLGGYAPTRRAHDALAVCDDELPDFGEKAFDGVFQPSMGLLSTRRPARISLTSSAPWPLERRDLDPETRALVERLSALPPLPPQLFGERGFQSTGADLRHLRPGAPDAQFTLAVRAGGDIAPFRRRSAELHCDPAVFGGRLRPAAEWRAVKLLIRQTARYPMVALSDGEAFRNSILAGFADEAFGEHLLLAYLNSTPVRWLHYTRHRDARQGMPQLKIAHLRAVPAPPLTGDAGEALTRIGRALGERNSGITAVEQDELDALVADILSLDEPARARIRAFGASMQR
jgi:hypothetical protein